MSSLLVPEELNRLPAHEMDPIYHNEISDHLLHQEQVDENYSKPDYLDLLDLEKILRKELKQLMPKVHLPAPSPSPQQQQNKAVSGTTTSIGTQINIENLNIDMSQKGNMGHEDGQCLVYDNEKKRENEQGLVLGSGDVDHDLLANVIKNFFGDVDRRKYKGKHKNSPMVIKFYE